MPVHRIFICGHIPMIVSMYGDERVAIGQLPSLALTFIEAVRKMVQKTFEACELPSGETVECVIVGSDAEWQNNFRGRLLAYGLVANDEGAPPWMRGMAALAEQAGRLACEKLTRQAIDEENRRLSRAKTKVFTVQLIDQSDNKVVAFDEFQVFGSDLLRGTNWVRCELSGSCSSRLVASLQIPSPTEEL